MDTNYITTNQSKTLDITFRIAIAAGLKHKDPITTIAKELGFSRQTIHNEINRGMMDYRTSNLDDIKVYDPWKAQEVHNQSASYKGRMKKIDEYEELKTIIEENLKNGSSPEIVEHIIKSDDSLVNISAKTIYNYLDNKDLEVGNEVLPYKKGKKKHKVKVEKGTKPNGGVSIEKKLNL